MSLAFYSNYITISSETKFFECLSSCVKPVQIHQIQILTKYSMSAVTMM